jgi:predicted TIM-barrel fold metal-dependent hydrolase
MKIPVLAALVLGAALALASSASRAQVEACGAPKAPYTGPMIDAMAQIESAMSRRVSDAFERGGVTRMALFARLHRKRNGESEVLALKKRFPERFYLGTPKPFDQHDDLRDWFVDKTAALARDDGYRFVGELLFAHADKAHGEQTPTGERFVAPDGKNVARLLSAIEQRPVPVMIHWEVYDWKRDWPAFHALYARFPKVTFIWPHAGFASVEQVGVVMAANGNVVVTLSKKEKLKHSLSSEEKAEALGEAVVDGCNRLLPEWRALFERYPDRFMFATDAHKDHRWVRYAQIVEAWRLILGQLPDPLAQSIAWRNAERVYAAPQ